MAPCVAAHADSPPPTRSGLYRPTCCTFAYQGHWAAISSLCGTCRRRPLPLTLALPLPYPYPLYPYLSYPYLLLPLSLYSHTSLPLPLPLPTSPITLTRSLRAARGSGPRQ